MWFTHGELKDQILEMYPEIEEHHIYISVGFSAEKNAYVITFMRGQDQLSTYLEKKDADECMNGIKCVYLGVQVAQFIKNFEERAVFGRKVA
jgi:alanyl-tRNA synthetase